MNKVATRSALLIASSRCCRARRRTAGLRRAARPSTARAARRARGGRAAGAAEHAAEAEEHGMFAGLLWPTGQFRDPRSAGCGGSSKSRSSTYLRDRHSSIRKDLVEAANVKAAAAAQLAEIDRKLQALPGEIEALRTARRRRDRRRRTAHRRAGRGRARTAARADPARDRRAGAARQARAGRARRGPVGAARRASACSNRSRRPIRIGSSIAISSKCRRHAEAGGAAVAADGRLHVTYAPPPPATRERSSTSPSRNRTRRSIEARSDGCRRRDAPSTPSCAAR